MPSTIRGSDNFDTAGGNAVKAWVNFNGTGTVAIRASYNVSSITDNGVGDYTVNFATALADANFGWSGNGVVSTAACFISSTTTTLRFSTNATSTGGAVDSLITTATVFR